MNNGCTDHLNHSQKNYVDQNYQSKLNLDPQENQNHKLHQQKKSNLRQRFSFVNTTKIFENDHYVKYVRDNSRRLHVCPIVNRTVSPWNFKKSLNQPLPPPSKYSTPNSLSSSTKTGITLPHGAKSQGVDLCSVPLPKENSVRNDIGSRANVVAPPSLAGGMLQKMPNNQQGVLGPKVYKGMQIVQPYNQRVQGSLADDCFDNRDTNLSLSPRSDTRIHNQKPTITIRDIRIDQQQQNIPQSNAQNYIHNGMPEQYDSKPLVNAKEQTTMTTLQSKVAVYKPEIEESASDHDETVKSDQKTGCLGIIRKNLVTVIKESDKVESKTPDKKRKRITIENDGKENNSKKAKQSSNSSSTDNSNLQDESFELIFNFSFENSKVEKKTKLSQKNARTYFKKLQKQSKKSTQTKQKKVKRDLKKDKSDEYIEYLKKFDFNNIQNLQILDNSFCKTLNLEQLQKVFELLKNILNNAVENCVLEKSNGRCKELELTLHCIHLLKEQNK